VSPYAPVLALWALIAIEAKRVGRDPAELAAIVHTESRAQTQVVKRESNGSCSVGAAGINVPDCDPQRVAALLDPATNLRVAANTLRAGAAWCRAHRRDKVCLRGGAVAMYNAGDKGYARRVQQHRRALARLISQRATSKR
jgi:soluble lytic murein transglycosylase-like protein